MISAQTLALLRLLADGRNHSGESLGRALGISRAAIWKSLQSVADLGIELQRIKGQGYRIEGGLSLLDAEVIRTAIASHSSHPEFRLAVFPAIDSTNRFLLDEVSESPEAYVPKACLAEMQTAGRGRRGRVWHSPFARNLYLSLVWRFSGGVQSMEGLSLAVGVAIVDALHELGCVNAKLKWPNDVLIDDAKLAGVLVEIAGDASGECFAVVGVGINVNASTRVMSTVDQAWTDIRQNIIGDLPERSEIAAKLIAHIAQVLSTYEGRGFGYYRERWEGYNAFREAEVQLQSSYFGVRGAMIGVSNSGALVLEIDGRQEHFVGGELSLRKLT